MQHVYIMESCIPLPGFTVQHRGWLNSILEHVQLLVRLSGLRISVLLYWREIVICNVLAILCSIQKGIHSNYCRTLPFYIY